MIETAVARAAVASARTVFFDGQLNPVAPEVGQWFCEFDDEFDDGEYGTLRDGDLVEYLGPDDSATWNDEAKEFLPYGDPMLRHLVCTEYGDEPRRPRGLILVRQS
jgi:hypothetical protein